MIDRLAEDHANARFLAESIAERDGVISAGDVAQPAPGRLDPARVTTNFVVFKVERDRAAFIDALANRGVLVVGYPHGQIRAVTHYGIERADIETTIGAFREALAEASPAPASAPGTLAGTAA
jgi:threonine aldolase